MNTVLLRTVGKVAVGLATEYGINQIIGYGIGKIVPESIKTSEKICIGLGAGAISLVASTEISDRVEKQLNKFKNIGFFKPEKKEEDSEKEEPQE